MFALKFLVEHLLISCWYTNPAAPRGVIFCQSTNRIILPIFPLFFTDNISLRIRDVKLVANFKFANPVLLDNPVMLVL